MLRSGRSGFTLLELLLVAMLLGVAAAVAAPRLGAIVPTMELNGAGWQVVDLLKAAQTVAVDASQQVWVQYDLARQDISIQGDGALKELRREHLPDGTFIARVKVAGRSDFADGQARVFVLPSGYVQPHEVVLQGTGGKTLRVESARLTLAVRQD